MRVEIVAALCTFFFDFFSLNQNFLLKNKKFLVLVDKEQIFVFFKFFLSKAIDKEKNYIMYLLMMKNNTDSLVFIYFHLHTRIQKLVRD